MKVEDGIKYALLAAGLYLLYDTLQGVKKIGAGATDMGNQLSELGDNTPDPTGDTFASWYDPTIRTVFFYYLTFPDGGHHLLWNSSVHTDGTFVGDDGMTYKIGVSRSGGLRAYAYA